MKSTQSIPSTLRPAKRGVLARSVAGRGAVSSVAVTESALSEGNLVRGEFLARIRSERHVRGGYAVPICGADMRCLAPHRIAICGAWHRIGL